MTYEQFVEDYTQRVMACHLRNDTTALNFGLAAWDAAVQAERHECAKLLEDGARMIPFGMDHQSNAYAAQVLNDFARLIRERK